MQIRSLGFVYINVSLIAQSKAFVLCFSVLMTNFLFFFFLCYSGESPGSSMYSTENGKCICNFLDSTEKMLITAIQAQSAICWLEYFDVGAAFACEVAFRTVCASLGARSVHYSLGIPLWGHTSLSQNVSSHKRLDLENFLSQGFKLQPPVLQGQSHQCGMGNTRQLLGRRWAPLTCWSLLSSAILK